MEEVFRECVAEERERGRTVLLSSHILSEVEALCDRVTIIRAGQTVETGTLAELRHLTRITIEAELADGAHVRRAGRAGRAAGRAGDGSCSAGVTNLVSRPPTLEELFLRHYEERGMSGLRSLLGLALRRDRVMIPAWVLGLGAAVAAHRLLLQRAVRRPRPRAARSSRRSARRPPRSRSTGASTRTRSAGSWRGASAGSRSRWRA